jgi:ketosteroid isomerase-like protein
MRFYAPAVLALVVAGSHWQEDRQPALDTKAETAAVTEVLMAQMEAWNRGDIPGFMDGYVRTEKLRFASAGTFRFGWKTTLNQYQKSYPNSDAMGQLTFSDLRVKILSKDWAEVFGRWELKRKGDFKDIGGLYTLLMQKTEKGWRVLHDHTSSRPVDVEEK